MIFDVQKIFGREAAVGRSLETLKSEMHEGKADRSRLASDLEAISRDHDAANAALNFAQLADFGADANDALAHDTMELFPGELVLVQRFRGSVLEFVKNADRYDAYIVCSGEEREHALLFIFTGVHGAIGCLKGLATGVEQTFGLQIRGNGAGARSALLSALSPSVALESSYTKFNSVALPADAGDAANTMRKYGAVLEFYLRGCCSKTDGRFEWGRKGTLESLRSLADVGWWLRAPAAKMILSAWSSG